MVCEYKQFWKTSFNENLLSSNCSQLQLISCEKEEYNAFVLYIPNMAYKRDR